MMTDAPRPEAFGRRTAAAAGTAIPTEDVTSAAAGNEDEACSGSLRFLRGDSGSGEEDPSSMAGRPPRRLDSQDHEVKALHGRRARV